MENRPTENPFEYKQVLEKIDAPTLPRYFKIQDKLYLVGLGEPKTGAGPHLIGIQAPTLLLLKPLNLEEAKKLLKAQDEYLAELEKKGKPADGT